MKPDIVCWIKLSLLQSNTFTITEVTDLLSRTADADANVKPDSRLQPNCAGLQAVANTGFA